MAIYSDLNTSKPLEQDRLYDIDAVEQALDNLLSTVKRDRFFEPEIGAALETYLFEFTDDITINEIKNLISDDITDIDDRIRIDKNQTTVTRTKDDQALEVVFAIKVEGLDDTLIFKKVFKRR